MEVPVPDSIGGYRIIELLGEGSMGRVYRARQLHPAREVALKLVAALGRDAAVRLRREIEVLARMEHPGIARLYDAGEEEIGGIAVPWLALEYVRGIDLRQWIRDRAPTLAERVQALIQLCRAVHYAHGRGVVHRDLKPANVLIDGAGRPRVLDFGIARVLDGDDGDATRAGQVLGSLPYMSPEQLGGDSTQIDARSDVYALGAIAYELICAALPHPRLADATLFEAIEVHRTHTPLLPSRVLPSLPRDLDAVIMKALSTEPARRYSSAAEFAADLQRWLEHRPVEARPATLGYVLARHARRHRVAAAALAAALIMLVAASLVSLRYAWSEAQARALAERRFAESEAVNAFLERMLSAADPAQTQGRDVTVTEVLDAAEQDLAGTAMTPVVRAMVQRSLASTRLSLGEFERALALNDAAISQSRLDGDPRVQHGLLRMRGSILTELGRFEQAEAALDEADSIWPQAPDADRLRVLLTRSRLYEEAGRQADAIAGFGTLLAAGEEGRVDPDDPMLETARSNLIGLLRDSGRLNEALVAADAVLARRRGRDGDRHPRTLASRHARMTVLQGLGKLDEAVSEGQAVLDLRRQVLGEDHAATLTTAQMLGNAYLELGRLDEAEPLIRQTLTAFESRFGDAHAQTITSLNALAYLLEARGAVDEAEATYRRVLAIQREQDQRHPAALVTQNNLGMLLLDAGRLSAAEHELRDLLARTAEQLGEDHVFNAMFASNLGLCLSRMRRDDEALIVLEAAHTMLADRLGAEHGRTQAAAERLNEIRARAGLIPEPGPVTGGEP